MDDLIDEVIWEDGSEQLRFTVSEFRGKMYLSLSYWYLTFEEDWAPTTKGVTLPYNPDTVTYLVEAFSKILSKTENELYFNLPR